MFRCQGSHWSDVRCRSCDAGGDHMWSFSSVRGWTAGPCHAAGRHTFLRNGKLLVSILAIALQENFTSVLLGFNPVHLARDAPIEKWDKTCKQV